MTTTRKSPQFPGLETVDLSGYPIATLAGHASERYENLRVILWMLYPLRARGALPAARVTIAGAEWQKAQGSRSDDTQAAHTLPRRIMIANASLTSWVTRLSDDMLSYAVANLEGTVTTLPTTVNKADSLWETKGLSAAYAGAAESILHSRVFDAAGATRHYRGVWTSFQQAAFSSLGSAFLSASGGVASVLGYYQSVHGLFGADPFVPQAGMPATDGCAYYWDMLYRVP